MATFNVQRAPLLERLAAAVAHERDYPEVAVNPLPPSAVDDLDTRDAGVRLCGDDLEAQREHLSGPVALGLQNVAIASSPATDRSTRSGAIARVLGEQPRQRPSVGGPPRPLVAINPIDESITHSPGS